MTVIVSGVGERSRWRGAPAPGIRMRRPPSLEPPDELAGFVAAGSELPLDWSPASAPAQRRPVGPAAPPSSVVASAQRYVRTCIEVLNGFRPASHLRTLSGPVEFGAVVAQLGRRRNGCGHFPQPASARGTAPHDRATPDPGPDPGPGPGPDPGPSPSPGSGSGSGSGSGQASAPPNASRQPTVAATGPTAHRGSFVPVGPSASAAGRRNTSAGAQPFRLQRMRIAEPRDGVAEIVAVLSYGSASLAVAMRLEHRGESWLCALVQVI